MSILTQGDGEDTILQMHIHLFIYITIGGVIQQIDGTLCIMAI